MVKVEKERTSGKATAQSVDEAIQRLQLLDVYIIVFIPALSAEISENAEHESGKVPILGVKWHLSLCVD